MREILFKAKRVDNGQWVEGYYTYTPKIQDRELKNTICQEEHLIHYHTLGCLSYSIDLFEVDIDPQTLSQYTGLSDKHGNKIFENDLVKYGEYAGLVAYSAPEYICLFKDIGGLSYINLNSTEEDFEVIGNKFDNPELLGE